MTDIDVQYRALRRAADDHDELAGRVRAARRTMESATIPGGSLGKLPQSDEIQAAFDERRCQAIDLADVLVDSMQAVADNLRATVAQYRLTDEAAAESMTART